MKKIIAVALAIILSLVFAVPAAAAPDKAYGPPESYTDSPIYLNEIIAPGVQVVVYGQGSYTRHIVKPGSPAAAEESWFEVTAFSGWFYIGPINPAIPNDPSLILAYIYQNPGVGFVVPSFSDARIKATVHLGTQPNQPVLTLRSTVPIPIPLIFGNYPGVYTNIQIVGGQIIHLK